MNTTTATPARRTNPTASFELYATSGQETTDWNGLFGTAVPDAVRARDVIRDAGNLPLDQEPALVREDLRL